MKIRVISLRDSAARRASIEQQLAAIGVDFEFFDAVTPDRAPHLIDGYDEPEFILNCGRGATDGEIACYASHLELWRDCVANNEACLILEDDAQLTRSFRAGLLVLMRQIAERGLIRAALPLPKHSLAVDQHGEFAIHYCRRVPLQTLAYAVSPRAASRLVQAGTTVGEPVDKFLQRFWLYQQRVYAILPAIVEPAPLAADSEIGTRSRHNYGLSIRLRRTLRKSHNSLARTFSNATFSPSH